MRYSTFIGLLVVLLKQCHTSKGGSLSNQSFTEVIYQDGQILPQDPELPAAEMMAVLSPPSLKEVQQAVREASKQVDSRGAGEVLKELLERVVEAALGHAERGSEAKDAVTEKEAVGHGVLGVKTGQHEAETEVKTLEQPVLDKNISTKEEDVRFEEEEEAEADAFEDIAVGEKEVVKREGETAAGSVEKSTEDVETGVRKAEGLEVTDESLGTKLSQEDTKKASEETKVDLERREEDSKKQVVLSVLKNTTETEIRDKEETPAAVEVVVDVQPKHETVNESKPGLVGADDEQIGNNWGKEAVLKEETQISEIDGEKIVLPSKDSETKMTKPLVVEPAKEEVKKGEYAEGREETDENGDLVVGGTEDTAETEGTYFKESTVDEINDKGAIKEESVALVNEGGDIKGEEEEQTTLKNSDDKEALVIPGLQIEDSTEAFIENRPEHQSPTPKPSVGEVESEENTLGNEKSDHSNEIITPAHDFLPHKPGRTQPTLDNFENDVLAEYHQAERGKPREANELVEDLLGIRETDERGLEAWKIGAIFATVFLVLETVVIILYVIKCRNKKRIATLNDSDAPSTLAKKGKQQDDEHAIAMSKLSSTSKWEPATSGPGPDSSQDLRTSV
ncbi:uncharacterized protein si:dkeyp-118a3.2 isoform X2 [Kryptolebias marmoratus]|uniref:uncharacterized protein si:dkeyp-118a3.2 isoform X2 n=1 Tax=Kryptolebias marmoratus TaxID=37003 RepID=UPI0007F8FB8F|nr:uncharacterized protein si:dkeyp-118a3.2 isoform X2 [Kryptolebias marmoratus]